MSSTGVNWIDLAVVVVLAWYAYDGWRRGVITLTLEFLGFVAALLAALLLYGPGAAALERYVGVPLPFAKPLAFFVIWSAVEYGYALWASGFYRRVPERYRASRLNRAAGSVPALLDGALLTSIVLSLAVAVPIPAAVKHEILSSRSGSALVAATGALDKSLSAVFGGAVKETLSFMTVRQDEGQAVDLHFTTRDFSPSPAEQRDLLSLVNGERAARGLAPLAWDVSLANIAEAHSADMLERGYFSHDTPEGKTPTDRADDAGYDYRTFGENLAFAPDVTLAHKGLMDSPGHRANVLSAEFTKIGIGIEDAGAYGIMVTQDFAR